MGDSRISPDPQGTSPTPPLEHRQTERFWPYVEPSEDPTPQELISIDPDVLFGPTDRRFSITLSFPKFKADDYERAVSLAKRAPEYREVGQEIQFRHRARFYPGDAIELRTLFEIVGRYDECQVLVDDRQVPLARELWLPLMWLLIRRV